MRDYTEQEQKRFHEFVPMVGKHHEKIKVITQTLILLLGFVLGYFGVPLIIGGI